MGYYDTFEPNHHDSYMGAWGVYPFLPSGNILLSDMQTGLYVFEVNYENPLSYDETLVNKNKIYPNPSDGIINVELTSVSKVELYDIQGGKVYEASDVLNLQIQTDTFSEGIYILKINDNKGTTTHKISIQ
jgi:hypothetical protein